MLVLMVLYTVSSLWIPAHRAVGRAPHSPAERIRYFGVSPRAPGYDKFVVTRTCVGPYLRKQTKIGLGEHERRR